MKTAYLFFLPALFVLIFSSALDAQIFVKSDANGAFDGTSWEDAFVDLQDALDASTLNSEIWVAAGEYKPGVAVPAPSNFFGFPQDLKLYGGFNGSETMLSERDFETNVTILSGDLASNDVDGDFNNNKTDNVYHIIFLTDTITSATIIDGFVMKNGNTLGSSGTGNDRRGGAILTYGSPQISNCSFNNNYGYFGAAVYPRGAAASGTQILDCTFETNIGDSGGAIYLAGLAEGMIANCSFERNTSNTRGGCIYGNESTVNINNCLFKDNNSLTSTAGAIQHRSNDDASTITISGCNFIGNSARWGGAVNTYDELSKTIIVDCAFSENSAELRGGGIYMGFKGRTEVYNCDFQFNVVAAGGGAISGQNDSTSSYISNSMFTNNGADMDAQISGGAVAMYGGMQTVIEDCFFEANNADFGGAITVQEDSANVTTFVLKNSIFSVNIATTQAGGVNIAGAETLIENCLFNNNFNSGAAGGALSLNTGGVMPTNIKIVNSTLVDNTAPIGAGLASYTDDVIDLNVEIQNTIFDNPEGEDYTIELGSPTLTSLGGNLSTGTTLSSIFGSNDIEGQDPMFVDVINFDFHLLEGSPCIDAGIDSGASLTDLEGTPRYGATDIGAYEFDKSVSVKTIDGFGEMKIFPNPVREQLSYSFESELFGDFELRLVDLRGNVMDVKNGKKGSPIHLEIIDVQQLATGIYHLQLVLQKQMIATRFVKI